MNEAMELPVSMPVPVSMVIGEGKSPSAFRTISEVADGLALPQHVLRFWESKFPQIKPLKRGGGRRYYRPEDVDTIREIKQMLYDQGLTIRGAQKLLRENSSQSVARLRATQAQLPISLQHVASSAQQVAVQQHTPAQGLSAVQRREFEGVLSELKSIRKILELSGI